MPDVTENLLIKLSEALTDRTGAARALVVGIAVPGHRLRSGTLRLPGDVAGPQDLLRGQIHRFHVRAGLVVEPADQRRPGADAVDLVVLAAAHDGQLGAGIDTAVECAELLIHEGRYTEAEKTLNELRSSHVNDAAINRGLGKLYKAQGKFDVAAVFLRRAVTEDPQDPVAHYTLAITLQRLHQDAEAKKELELFSAAKEERRFVRALEIASDPVVAREK